MAASSELTIILRALDKASKPVGNVTSSVDKLEKQSTSTVTRGLNPLKTALGAGIKVAAGAGVAAIGALTTAIGSSVGKAADLEEQMGGIAAVLNKTKDEVEPLKKLIVDLGLDPNLKVSSIEAAQAIEMLAKNGLQMTDILDGAARSTVLLANATDADFGTAADVATDVMQQFKIEAKDMAKAVNGITSVVNNSKFGITDYQYALASAGGVAATVGVSFDDFNTSIAAISPLFASGSDAGTSFKTFLQRLVPMTNSAIDEMRRLGLAGINMEKLGEQAKKLGVDITGANIGEAWSAVAEATGLTANQFSKFAIETGILSTELFDANGDMQDMGHIAGALQDALGGLSDQQKIQALSTIYGSDAMRAAAAMADIGEEKFNQLKATMGNTDAEEAAATRVDNLRGALDILSGVFEALQLKIGERFIPVLRRLVEAFTTLVTDNQDRIVGMFNMIADAVTLAIDNFGLIKDAVMELISHFITFNFDLYDTTEAIQEVAMLFGMTSDKALWLSDIIFKASVAWEGFLTAVKALFAPIVESIGQWVEWKDVLNAAFVLIGAMVLPAIGSFIAAMTPIIAVIAGAIAIVTAMRHAWETDWGGIKTALLGAVDVIMRGFNDVMAGARTWQEVFQEMIQRSATQIATWGMMLWDWVKLNLPTWIAKLGEWAKAIWQWIIDSAPIALQKLKEWTAALLSEITAQLPFFTSKLLEWGGKLWGWILSAIPPTLSKLGEWGAALFGWIAQNLPTWISKLGEWGKAALDWLGTATSGLGAKMGEWARTAYDYVTTNLPSWKQKLQGWGAAAAEWITSGETTSNLRTNLESWRKTIFDWYNSRVPSAGEFLGWITGIVNWIADSAPKAIEMLGDMIVKMVDWLLGPGKDAFIGGVSNMFSSVGSDGADSPAAKLIIAIGKMATKVSVALVEAAGKIGWAIISGIIEAFIPGAERVHVAIENFVANMWSSFKRFLGIASPSTIAYSLGTSVVFGLINGFNAIMDGFVSRHIPSVLQNLVDRIKSSLSPASWRGIGWDMVQGLIDGFNVKMDEFVRHMSGTAEYVKSLFRSLFGINSPSKVFMEYGQFIMEGLSEGLLNSLSPVLGAVNTVASGVDDQVTESVTNNVNNVRNYNVSFQGDRRGRNGNEESMRASKVVNALSALAV